MTRNLVRIARRFHVHMAFSFHVNRCGQDAPFWQ